MDRGRDVWFTCGWTLQELLAPRTMKFYGRGWAPLSCSLNDKQDATMMNALSRPTRIPLDDLRYFRPGTQDMDERMTWVSTRTTTRIEDIAYCLICIFDVSMTIAYGEEKRAFRRLVEAIIHRCGEWQIVAWAGQLSAYSAALAKSLRCFRQLASYPKSTGSGEYEQKAWRGDQNYVMRKQGLQLRLSLKECTRYGRCTVGVWQKVETTDLLTVFMDMEVKERLTTVWL
ncbi:hypothetical protein F5I97DRAFT_1892586 [Phlebopus sp. FC_14]|nr:hypothetical protein F5I97DRAFT_1892586 [Phlebopus sp. FC_14]